METKTKTATAETAYKKTLPTPINYSYSWKVYANNEEMLAASDGMSLDEQRRARNAAAQANARTKALNAALDAAGIVQPTAENDPQIALRDMLKTLLTAKLPDGTPKYTEEAARAKASEALDTDWED